MDIKQFFSVIRRRWISISLILLVALGASAALSFQATPQYESSARVFVSISGSEGSDAYAAGYFVQSRVESYSYLASSSELMEGVIDDLNLDLSPEELADRVTAEVVPDTSLIQVTVTDPDPRAAQTNAKWLALRYAEYLTSLETPQGAEEARILASVTDTATYNPTPVTPRTALNLIVAGLIGLLLGLATALVREILDRTITTQHHIKEVTHAPVLASVGFDKDIRDHPVLTSIGSFAPRTEAFRLLRTNLQFLDLDDQPRCLVISSAVAGEGKTMTSTNLAVALAQTGRRTLVIDADLRRPRIAGQLDLDSAVGLTTVLVGKANVQDAIQVHEPSGLHFLASGAKPPNPTEILQSRVTQDLIKQLRDEYEMVIIDAPPLLPVADASVLATMADGTIVVIKHGSSTRDQLAEAITRLHQVGGRLFGVVVNMVPRRTTNNYYYYYYEESDTSRRS